MYEITSRGRHTITTYAYVVADAGARPVAETERAALDAFIAAFVAKKGGPPAGHWRVPGVGYCVFLRTPLEGFGTTPPSPP